MHVDIQEDLRQPPASLPPALRKLPPGPERPIRGKDDAGHLVGWLVKRTYDLDAHGHCRLADEQRELRTSFLLYDESVSGEEPPVAADDDTLCFRRGTDLVIQGSAHPRDDERTRTHVRVETAGLLRDLVVVGDRTMVWEGGRLRFTDPKPISEPIPIRYDRAYGGHDRGSAFRFGDPARLLLEMINPELVDATTDWHYPRNPSGSGFVLEGQEQAANGVRVPNIEFPFDPLSPQRIVCPSMGHWPVAPLPAGLDWCHPLWFPRSAYLGLVADYEDRDVTGFAEIAAGWAPAGLLDYPSPVELPFRAPPAAASSGASPGMTLSDVAPDAQVALTGLSVGGGTRVVKLPGEVPFGTLRVAGLADTELTPHLNSVLIDLEAEQLVLTWRMTAPSRVPFETLAYQDAICPTDWRPVSRTRTRRWWGGAR